MRFWTMLIGGAALLVPTTVQAQGSKASSPAEFARRIDRLKPGDWVWASQIAPNGPILIYVDLSRQVGIVYRNGVRIAATTVSSGKKGYDTPTGVFTILQKDADHRSNKYNNAPMPFQQRLTWDGVALHAGGLPGYPESHGCIHLPYVFARELFGLTSMGMTVVVQGDAANHVETTPNSLLAPFDAKGQPLKYQPLETGEEYRWTPQKAPSGPMTIIISRLDQRIVVLRGGTEIGRSAAQIDSSDTTSHVATLVSRNGRLSWVYVGLAGHSGHAGVPVDEAAANRVRMPRKFYALLRAEVKPGTTVLITNSRVDDKPPAELTIMDAVAPQASGPATQQ